MTDSHRTGSGLPASTEAGRKGARPARIPARWLLAAVALVVLGALAYLVFRPTDATETATSGSLQLEHVHGLGVDPSDDTLYAGTHFGLVRLPQQGEARRVAERVQDFMGFTVAGPGHFLASGHPGEGQGGPSSLGLIESTDGGQTWQSLSLAGEADFHALEYRHRTVYGVNSLTGEFMVSADKREWDVRSSVPMADFAVSPEDPDLVLATTERGLARSADGGRNFVLVPDAPLMQFIAWAEDGTAVGVAPDGALYVAGAGAEKWDHRGELDGRPEALAAVSEKEIYVAAEAAVLISTDGGRSFRVHYQG